MRRVLLLALACAALTRAASALEVPFLSGRVNDNARLFDASTASRLEKTLKDYESRTGRQFVVLTIPSLENDPLEEYSIKVARTWKLGRKGKDDGVLLLVARDDRKVRVEVGYGLEGALPDALSGRIIRNEMVPRFRGGDYGGGVTAGVDAVIKALDGKYSPPPDAPSGRRGSLDNPSGAGLLDRIAISFFVFGVLGVFECVGLTAPGVGWFLYFFLIPFWAAFPMALWGVKFGMTTLVAHLTLFPILKMVLGRTDWGRKIAKSIAANGSRGHGYSSGGGWSSGDWGGGGFGGGDSGGFSGGGGDFGGGGSSGSW